jgi:hypothetical protein
MKLPTVLTIAGIQILNRFLILINAILSEF